MKRIDDELKRAEAQEVAKAKRREYMKEYLRKYREDHPDRDRQYRINAAYNKVKRDTAAYCERVADTVPDRLKPVAVALIEAYKADSGDTADGMTFNTMMLPIDDSDINGGALCEQIVLECGGGRLLAVAPSFSELAKDRYTLTTWETRDYNDQYGKMLKPTAKTIRKAGEIYTYWRREAAAI